MAGGCARQFCNARAVARVDFDGEARIVWIDELDDPGGTRPAAACRLCRAHADRLAPPRNWDLHDLRAAPEAVVTAAAAPAWSPHLFPDGDLGGVLDARSPLLSRAFRGVRTL